MGLFEIHLHDPEFEFAPSVGSETARGEEPGSGPSREGHDDSSGNGGAMGALVALALLVVLGVAVRRLRSRGREKAGELEEEYAEQYSD